MKRPGQYHRHARLQGQHAAGSLAIRTYVCSNPKCEVRHRPYGGVCVCRDSRCDGGSGKMPKQCHCGGIEFITFSSDTEALAWLLLRSQEKRGLISDLKRQVPLKLLAWTPAGQPYEVAVAVLDFSFIEDGKYILADAKPKSGVDDLANLKFKIAAANGTSIRIITS